MSEFVLLYRTTSEAREEAMGTPQKTEQSLARWRAWFDEMKGKGQLRNIGIPLDPPGKVVRGRNRTVIDGPYSETKELIGGFSVVEAKDIAEAARIAAGCPILEGGGSVEVRPVRQLDP
ncbi:MAG TPA: YciI family protein [Usitatibacter sp.]|nr:YciI family protein [Usitatibacter sp.]